MSQQSKAEKARQAALRRSSEKNKKANNMNDYYMVIGGFCAVMAGAGVYTVLNPQQSFATTPIIDEASILVHNGQSHRFQQSANDFFGNWTISDAKQLFEQGLSDTQQIEPCRSGQNQDMEIPISYDWRQQYPDCVREAAPQIDKECASSYVHTALSAVEDRVCMGSNKRVTLSAKEVLECDQSGTGCKGGTVNRVLAWGKRKGFVSEECYESPQAGEECTAETLQENECRQSQNIYKVVDFCLANEVDGLKKEIMTNGPVIGQISPYTDFLLYSNGVYQRTQEAFKYNGSHVVKVLGWERTPDGASAWIIENTWGASWGDNGYALYLSNGESALDFFGLGLAAYPNSMAEYYAQQQAQQQAQYGNAQEFTFTMPDAPEGDESENVFDFDLDNIEDLSQVQQEEL